MAIPFTSQNHNEKKFLHDCLLQIIARCRSAAKTRFAWQSLGSSAAILIATLSATPGVTYAADAEQIVTTLCGVCHGMDGVGVAPMFPNLAGQYNTYLAKQLNDYIAGRRKNDIMSPNVVNLTPADVAALAAYFSAKKPAPGHAGDAKLIEVGKVFYVDGNSDTGVPGCVGCHLDEGVGNKTYPRLAGQNAAYIAQQLVNFRSGARANDSSSLMRAVAAHITDGEIAAVAEYLASLGS
ncbi:MAG TPA: c-type cytochrome [Gallionella sp.]|nr:c-type cytochrome [Gallionella sp.]